jgi:CheY-like chemotaxis protein
MMSRIRFLYLFVNVVRVMVAAEARTSLLLVEDDLDIQDVLAEVLSEVGYQVSVAGEGREALAFLKTHPHPAVILLDLMMPGMDGYAFRGVQLAEPGLAKIPVIVITAQREIRGEAFHFADVLAKPINLPVLLATIERVKCRHSPGS